MDHRFIPIRLLKCILEKNLCARGLGKMTPKV